MIIGIPLYDGVDLLDVTAPHEVLSWMNPAPTLQLIGKKAGETITARDGFRFLTTNSFTDKNMINVLWVPGGNPPQLSKLMHREPDGEFLDYLIDRAATADFVCSVCEGALLLAAAGLLDGYNATTHWAFYKCLESFPNINVVDGFPRFVLDRNRLTGGGISSGIDESLELVKLLTRSSVAAQQVQQTIQYYPQAPYPNTLKPLDACPAPGLSWPL